jgi:hypothetical protein
MSVSELACDRRHQSAFQTNSPRWVATLTLRLINIAFPTLYALTTLLSW